MGWLRQLAALVFRGSKSPPDERKPGASSQEGKSDDGEAVVDHVPAAHGLPQAQAPEGHDRASAPSSSQERASDTLSVVGLDFGTSSTKVAYRQLGHDRSWVLPAAQPDRSFPWFCTPTTYQVKVGTVWFGIPSQAGSRALKLELLDVAAPQGTFGEVERRVIAYLGFVLESSLPLICGHLDVDRLEPRFNVGVPMSLLGCEQDYESRKAKYIDVAKAAIATTTAMGGKGIEQAMGVQAVAEAVDDGIARADSVNTVWVLPESIAALVSLGTDPAMEERAYSVIDVGAGTTEVSTSQVRLSATGKHKVACYHDSTHPYGALGLEARLSSGEASRDAVRPLWRQWAASWETSKRKDRLNPNTLHSWARTTVLFAGGGSQHPRLRSYFKQQSEGLCPVKQSFGDDTDLDMRRYVPPEQVLGAIGTSSEGRGDFHMLAVAHGLSFMQREWPVHFKPDEVREAEPAENFQPVPGRWV